MNGAGSKPVPGAAKFTAHIRRLRLVPWGDMLKPASAKRARSYGSSPSQAGSLSFCPQAVDIGAGVIQTVDLTPCRRSDGDRDCFARVSSTVSPVAGSPQHHSGLITWMPCVPFKRTLLFGRLLRACSIGTLRTRVVRELPECERRIRGLCRMPLGIARGE